jgi:hypothetical protein
MQWYPEVAKFQAGQAYLAEQLNRSVTLLFIFIFYLLKLKN